MACQYGKRAAEKSAVMFGTTNVACESGCGYQEVNRQTLSGRGPMSNQGSPAVTRHEKQSSFKSKPCIGRI